MESSESLSLKRWEEICSQIRCPTCINLNLCHSQTLQSQAMKEDILRRFPYQSNEEILEDYVRNYSEWILTTPPFWDVKSNWIWSLPLSFFLFGFVWLSRGFLREKKWFFSFLFCFVI